MHLSKNEKIFSAVNYALLGLFTLLSLYPFWEVLRLSFCSAAEAGRTAFSLWPREFSLDGYRAVLENPFLWLGYRNTLVRILLGMGIQMALMVTLAYPLSKKGLPHRALFTLFIVFTMFFRGGLIPDYLLVKALGMDNTLWALVLPRAVNTFGLIVLRNYFMTVPDSLEESAKLDGASDLTVLLRIYLPLSLPILLTVFLWGTVWLWNEWFHCLIFIRDGEKYVLQAVLRKIIIDAAPEFSEMAGGNGTAAVSVEVIKAASIVVSTLPIMLLYPFIQKHFIKGMVMGAIKE